MIRSIIFDFGNVLGYFDHAPALRRMAGFSRHSAATLRKMLYTAELEDDYESGRLSNDEFLRRVLRQGELTCNAQTLAAAYSDIFWPNTDVCALVPLLKPRYRLLLGSNTTELHAQQFRRQFAATLEWFDHLVLSYEIGVRKPLAGFFEHCVRRAECTPGECVFIDDLPANVAGAQACGLHGIPYRNCDDLCAQLTALGIELDPRGER
jgi:putative hydrolase of the HAD superfamily